jgi:hypothetical protein
MCVGVYALTWLWLGRGLLGILLAQVGLLVAVGAARAWLSDRRGGG